MPAAVWRRFARVFLRELAEHPVSASASARVGYSLDRGVNALLDSPSRSLSDRSPPRRADKVSDFARPHPFPIMPHPAAMMLGTNAARFALVLPKRLSIA